MSTQTLMPMVKQRNHVQKDASSPVCLHLAKKWYEECCTNHDSCSILDGTSSPTRLIAIEGEGYDLRCRLIELPRVGIKYAALSHRWDKNILKTTRENKVSMLREIPRLSLPKTFIDAIFICRYLNIFHLWIDSLCILQDDQIDWQSESARMADIYQNACLVIAASAATDGILVPRPNNFIKSHEYHDGGNSLEIAVAPWIYHNHEPGGQEPLSARGWTLQERLLSRRFLSFNAVEIHWECQSLSLCECSSGIDNRRDARHNNIVDMLGENDQEVYYNWRSTVISRYSGRKLTEASDKLPAISAVARRFYARLASRYLAGLWEGDLLSGLLWKRFWPEIGPKMDQIPSDYRAPSWSWASINSACASRSQSSSKSNDRATVIDVQCNPATIDEFSEVKSGFVKLRGPLAECWVTFPPEGVLPWHRVNLYIDNQEELKYPYTFMTDSPLELTRGISIRKEYENGVQRTNFTYKASSPYAWYSQPRENNEFSYPENIAKVWCLWIREDDALVLGHSKASPDKFVRLGILHSERKVRDVRNIELDLLFRNGVISTVTIV